MKDPVPEHLKQIEAYCRNETCGDPVPGPEGTFCYTKRRLIYSGASLMDNATYVCPVCGTSRIFTATWDGHGYEEKYWKPPKPR
jgi:hypothetical protein